MTIEAAQRSESQRTRELVLIFALVASSCLGTWEVSRSLILALTMAFVGLAVLVFWTGGKTDLHLEALGLGFQMKHKF
jgi:hypothetical protein